MDFISIYLTVLSKIKLLLLFKYNMPLQTRVSKLRYPQLWPVLEGSGNFRKWDLVAGSEPVKQVHVNYLSSVSSCFFFFPVVNDVSSSVHLLSCNEVKSFPLSWACTMIMCCPTAWDQQPWVQSCDQQDFASFKLFLPDILW
jgi:hypothetical protein